MFEILSKTVIKTTSACPKALGSIIAIVKLVLKVICYAIPVILIVLSVLDIAKIVTAGNIDDKLKKEVTGRITTRLIFAILIFLVPTIVRLVFGFIPIDDADMEGKINGLTWEDCWDNTTVDVEYTEPLS